MRSPDSHRKMVDGSAPIARPTSARLKPSRLADRPTGAGRGELTAISTIPSAKSAALVLFGGVELAANSNASPGSPPGANFW